MQSVVAHLDMNSYFASCEQQDNPQLRGKPVGVCEHLGGIIIAASIEAKRWGIKTGTPVWEARRIFPKIALTHTHPENYRMYTRRLVKLVSDYTDDVELYSIDEVFLDLTRVSNVRLPGGQKADPFQEAGRIAKEIKSRMSKEVGDWLKCSIGIAENKLLAKIASDLKKPDGLTILRKGDKQGLYEKLKLTDVPGIGNRMEKRLNALGIYSLKDLKNYPKSRLVAAFGVAGFHLYHIGQLEGSFKPEVEEEEEIKSVGHMYTLPEGFREKKFFVPVLYKLCEMVARRLRRKGLCGRVLHLHIHDRNHECFGKSKKLSYSLDDGREVFLESMSIFESRFESAMREALPAGGFRLIGVTLSGLTPLVNQQSLFGAQERARRTVKALDLINDKYGDFSLCRAQVLEAKSVIHDSIGFGRIKEL